MKQLIRKVPVDQVAIQWDGTNSEEIATWTERLRTPGFISEGTKANLWVAASNTWVPMNVSDWVTQDQLGFYPIADVVVRQSFALLGPAEEAGKGASE